jgi:hypothetical protein
MMAPAAQSLGYPSVAHYIINTFLIHPKSENDDDQKPDLIDDEESDSESEEEEKPELDEKVKIEIKDEGDVTTNSKKRKETSKPKPAKKIKTEKPKIKKEKIEIKSEFGIDSKSNLRQTKLSFAKEEKEVLIACRAPKGDPDKFWIAKLVNENSKKNLRTVLVQWYERPKKKRGLKNPRIQIYCIRSFLFNRSAR